MVVFVPLTRTDDGTYRGEWEPFAVFNPARNFRPVDVAVGPDGALYIAEWQTAAVYRVAYVGEEAAPGSPPGSPTPTPEPIPEFPPERVAEGKSLYLGGAPGAPPCVTCHRLDGGAGLGPSLEGLREVAGTRVPGMNAMEYVRQSILHPNDYIVPGYNSGYMYQDYGNVLTDDQLNALTAYVLSLPTAP